jgi:hypothetical protein
MRLRLLVFRLAVIVCTLAPRLGLAQYAAGSSVNKAGVSTKPLTAPTFSSTATNYTGFSVPVQGCYWAVSGSLCAQSNQLTMLQGNNLSINASTSLSLSAGTTISMGSAQFNQANLSIGSASSGLILASNGSDCDTTATPGNATCFPPRSYGKIALAAGGTSATITVSGLGAGSDILITPRSKDATCTAFYVTSVAAGSFTVTSNAACAATTVLQFFIISL